MAVMGQTAVDRLAEIRARTVFELLDVGPDEAVERLPSVTNEVWASRDLILRVSRRADGRLMDEKALVERLPAEIGHPEIVGAGHADGVEWMATRRRPGVALSRAWPRLDEAQRADAIDQLAARLRILHGVEPQGPAPRSVAPQLVDFERPDPLEPIRDALRRASRLDHVSTSMLRVVAGLLDDASPLMTGTEARRVIHGDLSFENILYDQGRITAVLDFEWSRPAPPDLDLDVLLRFVYYPKLHVAPDYVAETSEAHYRSVPRRLEQAYPELFATDGLLARLLAYSIGFDVHELLRFPPDRPADMLHPNHPVHRLGLTADGRSHLHYLTGTAT